MSVMNPYPFRGAPMVERPTSFPALRPYHRPLSRGFLWTTLAFLVSACEPPIDPPPPPAKVPVTSEVVSSAPFEPRLLLLGKVEPAGRLELRARDAGTLRYARRFAEGLRTGETVREGEPLFSLENHQVELQLTEARLAEKAAIAELERARTGVEGGFLPEMELERRTIEKELTSEQLEAARHRSGRLAFNAPVAGVLEIEAVLPPGSEVSAGTLIGYLAAAGAPRVEAWASADDLEHLRPGLRVQCRAPGERQAVAFGVVREVGRQVGDSGTARVVVEIADDLALPAPGQGVEVDVVLELREAALTVPVEAVVIEGGGHHAFVLTASGDESRAEARRLQVGRRSEGRFEVLDGLREGDRIAVRGAELLADGQRVIETGQGGGSGEQRSAR